MIWYLTGTWNWWFPGTAERLFINPLEQNNYLDGPTTRPIHDPVEISFQYRAKMEAPQRKDLGIICVTIRLRLTAGPIADTVIRPSVSPRMERSGNPGTRVVRHGLALWLWPPD